MNPHLDEPNLIRNRTKMAARSAYKFGQNLKELRIHLCQKSTASKGVRLVNNLISNLVFANKVFYFIMT